MKKYLLVIAISAALPFTGFAASNDVVLTTSAILSVGCYNLTVSGTSASIGSVTVGASNFSVVLQPGSLIAVSSASGQVLANNAPEANVTGNQCVGGVSTLTLSSVSSSDVTVTVTPSASTCTGSATNSTSANTGGGGSPGGGGGGGGGYNFVTPAATTAKPSIPATTAVTSAPSVASATTAAVAIPSYVFKKPLSVGITSPDAKVLQQILNVDPDTRVAASGAGSVGKETNYFGPATKVAIQKFQVKYKIAKAGEAGYGTLGPKTRAKLNEIAGKTISVPSVAAPSKSVSASSAAIADITKQLNDSLKLLQALQEQLKALKK